MKSKLFFMFFSLLIISLIFGGSEYEAMNEYEAMEENGAIDKYESTDEETLVNCVFNYDIGIAVCEEDAELAFERVLDTIDENILTSVNDFFVIDEFVIKVPEGYFYVEDIKSGSEIISLYLLYINLDEEVTTIEVEHIEVEILPIKYIEKLIREGLLDREFTKDELSDTIFYENNDLQIATFNSTYGVDGEFFGTSYGIIKSKGDMLFVTYNAKEPDFSSFYEEFVYMINSAKFGKDLLRVVNNYE